jgi:phosphoribosyl-AMP cyclohydrolase / phosphoribosyl-ATP pyrophosphohydrolase
VIVPSIDLSQGTTVQLVEGERLAIDAGDPIPLLERFAVVGEVAVIDIDAARGEGDNKDLISDLCRRAKIRVGGGIRDRETAIAWLDRGAEKVIIGTAASPELLAALPRDRVLVALDSRDGQVVSHGWRQTTEHGLIERVEALRDLCAGFLVTFVEREGHLGGTDHRRAAEVVAAAGDARVTIAGGVTTAEEVAELDRIGADAQVGMALYTGKLGLGEAVAAVMRSDRPDGLWPTVVVDQRGTALGLAYSDAESLERAITTGCGVYHSRSRGLWVKGESSGAVQELRAVDVDCDRDTLRFTVHQHAGFCHTGDRTCWGDDRGLGRLQRRLFDIRSTSDASSNTRKLLADPELLSAKLVEEAGELGNADDPASVAAEAADLLYFLLVKTTASDVALDQIEAELDHRERRLTRRPMTAKERPE